MDNYFVDCTVSSKDPPVMLSWNISSPAFNHHMVEPWESVLVWTHPSSLGRLVQGDHVNKSGSENWESLQWVILFIILLGSLYRTKEGLFSGHGFHHLDRKSREKQCAKGEKWNQHRKKSRGDRWRRDLDGESFVQFIPKARLHSCPWISRENPYFLLINISPCPPSYLALISVAYDQN